jgi:hypothetical protein
MIDPGEQETGMSDQESTLRAELERIRAKLEAAIDRRERRGVPGARSRVQVAALIRELQGIAEPLEP